jgi:hypothetical protein
MSLNFLEHALKYCATRAWLIVAFFALPIFAASVVKGTPGKIITSDGNAYYAWLTTLAADGDLKFRNDFMNLYSPDPVDWIEKTEGEIKNVTPPGMALIMAPGFLVAHGVATLAQAATGVPITPYDPLYKNITGLWLFLLFLFGVASFQRVMENFTGHSAFAVGFTLLAVLGTNLVHYIAKEPSMGHATVFTLTSIATRILLEQKPTTFNARAWLTAGALVGLLAIVRNSTVVLLPWWLALGLVQTAGSWSNRWRSGLCAGSAAALVFAVQPLMLSLMTGSFTLNGYSTYGFSSGFEGVWKGLLSARHGLLAYHPVWVGILGGVVFSLKLSALRPYALAALVCFSGAVIINGTWPFWWFGDSFGNRAYIDVLAPCAAVAGAALYSVLKPFEEIKTRFVAACIAGAFISANLVLWLGYLLRRYPSDGLHSYSEAWLWWLK